MSGPCRRRFAKPVVFARLVHMLFQLCLRPGNILIHLAITGQRIGPSEAASKHCLWGSLDDGKLGRTGPLQLRANPFMIKRRGLRKGQPKLRRTHVWHTQPAMRHANSFGMNLGRPPVAPLSGLQARVVAEGQACRMFDPCGRPCKTR